MQCIQVHDVDAASTIHHELGELHTVDQGVDDHGVLVLRGHKVWVVHPVPSYWNFRPAQVLGDWRESGHQDPQRGLLLSDGGGAKESVVDWSLLCEGVLALVVALGGMLGVDVFVHVLAVCSSDFACSRTPGLP